MFARDVVNPMPLAQVRLECLLEMTDIIPDSHSRCRARKVEQGIPHYLTGTMIRRFPASLGVDEVCSDGG